MNPKDEVLDAVRKAGVIWESELRDALGYSMEMILQQLLREGKLEELDSKITETGGDDRKFRVMRTFERAHSPGVEFRQFHAGWGTCRRCVLGQSREGSVCLARGNLRSRVMLLADRPEPECAVSGGIPFATGAESGEMEQRMRAASLDWHNTFLTYTVACPAPGESVPKDAVEQCRPHVAALLDIVYPQVVGMIGVPVMERVFAQPYPSFPLHLRGVVFHLLPLLSYRGALADADWAQFSKTCRKAYAGEFAEDQPGQPIRWNLPIRVGR